MNIKTRPIEYKDGKTNCIGYLAWDDNRADPLPCVLINHAWGGLDSFAMDKAVQMAALSHMWRLAGRLPALAHNSLLR